MIDIYFKSSKIKTNGDLNKIGSFKKGCWINVVNPSEEELLKLSEEFNIPKEALTDVFDFDSIPDFYKEEDEGHISMILRIPFYEPDGELITMPLGIILPLKKDCVITICKNNNSAIDNLIFSKSKKYFFTDKKETFLIHLLKSSIFSFNKQLSIVEKEIDSAERALRSSLGNKEIVFLLSLQKTLVYFRTSMVGNKKVVEKFSNGKIVKLNEEDKELLYDLMIDVSEIQQLIDIFSTILGNTMDAYVSIVSNNLNSVMKLLTFITIAVAIPTAVASFYGMNVELPIQFEPYAFWYVFLFSIFLTFLYFIYLNHKKWL